MIQDLIDLTRLSLYDINLKEQANILQRNTAYTLGQFVYRGNVYLECTTAGTTATTALSLSSVNVGDVLTDGTAEWTVFDPFAGTSGSGIQDWSSSTSYSLGDVVIYGNGIYQCNTAHTSTSSFDSSKFTNLSIGYEKINLHTGSSFNTATTTITTSSSMLTKDFLIIKIAYSDDGINVLMNKSYFVVPVTNEVHDFSYFESTTDYIDLQCEITGATTIVFNFLSAYTIDNFKVVSIDGVTLGSSSNNSSGTTISDWVANTTYQSGDLVIYNNSIWKCTTGNSNSSWTASNWQELGSSGGTTISDWATSTTYAIGDLVIEDNAIWQCNTAHTSSTFSSDISNWTLLGNKGIDYYTVGESYNINDIVIYNGNIYQCTTAHTATSTFNTSYWSEVSASENGISNWQSSTAYVQDDIVIYQDCIYRCDTAHTSTSIFDSQKFTQLTYIPETSSSLIDDIFGS